MPKRTKKLALVIFASLLAALVWGAFLAQAAWGHASSFPDVSESSYFHDALEKLASTDPPIISGFTDGSFKPDAGVTRAQFAKIIVRAKGIAPTSPEEPSFHDLPKQHWAYPFVEAAKKAGILEGYPDGSFRPEAPVTRAELSRGVVFANSWNDTAPALPSFADVQTDYWAFADIERSFSHRVVRGYSDGTFQPDRPTARAEAVIVIYRMLYPQSTRLIAIDPGHGGEDPGAVGNGLEEKEVNLDVALRLRSMLLTAGYGIVMPRVTDTTVSLQTRCDIANAAKADIFISIHHNSSISSAASGTEVYYYPGSVEGKKLAEKIHSELVKLLGLRDRGVDSAEFYVLRHTIMPAVLAEAGFVSNPSDAAKLKTDEFRQLEAQAIRNGIVSYFEGQ